MAFVNQNKTCSLSILIGVPVLADSYLELALSTETAVPGVLQAPDLTPPKAIAFSVNLATHTHSEVMGFSQTKTLSQ